MKVGFIGAGNMATALLEGMIAGGAAPEDFVAFDISPERMDAMRALGVKVAYSVGELAEEAFLTVLAVKPKFLPGVLADLRELRYEKHALSIAVGWTQAMLEEALPTAAGIAHAMPNTPAQVREGVTVVNDNHTMAPGVFTELLALLGKCGRVSVIPESLFDAVTGISGSGPAYAYMFIEALADAGVRQGLPRQMAYELAAQMLVGAGRMALESGQHPGALKDAVTSPGGTTIEAVYALEKAGFRGAVMDAVDACARKAGNMTKK